MIELRMARRRIWLVVDSKLNVVFLNRGFLYRYIR